MTPQYYAEHAEELKAKAAQRYADNPAKLIARSRAYYAENKQKCKAQTAGYRVKNAEKLKASGAKHRTEISPSYAARAIGLKTSQLTPEILALKREQLTLHRLARQLRKAKDESSTDTR